MSEIPEIIQNDTNNNLDFFGGMCEISYEGQKNGYDLYLAGNCNIGGPSILYLVQNNNIIEKKYGLEALLYLS